jgi:hypothetical protein
MTRFALAVVTVAALLAFPSSAFATHNDPFAGARDGQADLVPDEETVSDNVDYTTQAGELLDCGGSAYGKTAWFRLIAERSGPHAVTTFGSDFDTVLSVYTAAPGGAIPGAPQRVLPSGCNDDADPPNDRTSFVDFNAQAGQVYYVQVGGFDDGGNVDEGEIKISAFQPPPNDNRAAAETVGIGGAVFGYNFNTSQEAGERGDCNGVPYGSTVWYKATAPAIGDASITVTSTDMDPVVAVYPAGSNTPLGCNDDGPGQTTSSSLTGRVSPGLYEIQVGGLEGEQGTFEIRVTFAADPDLDDDGSATGQDCNDGNPNIRPGLPEQLNNDIDENCDNVREFDRDGDGSRVPGSPGDCDDGNPARSPLKAEVPGNAVDENCDNVVTPYDLIPSRVVSAWDLGRVTRMTELVLSNARRGSTVTLRCSRGCKLKSKRIRIRRNARQMQLQDRLTKRQRAFGPKARLSITLSGPGWSPKVTAYRMRPGKVPRRQELCYADRREC